MEKDKIKIKLERHKWPDEIEKEKRKKRKILVTLLTIMVTFALGWTAGSIFYKDVPSKSNKELARFERVYNRLLDNWYFKNEMDDPASEMIENAIKGMIELNGDDHTSYMTLEESQQFTESIDMSFVGIGVQYFADENLITRVFKGSPAEKAGILPGDIMVGIDDVLIEDLEEDEDIKDYILGERGTPVSILINRMGEELKFDVIRDSINALTWGEMIDEDTAYLEISSFGSSLRQATELYLKDFKQRNAKNLILDFRDNGGGYLDAINELSKLFFEEGTTIYFEKFTDGKEVEYKLEKNDSEIYEFDKIVVLVNEHTASASEVFALALRENLEAIIVGNTTFGKGTVQTQIQDGVDSSFLKYTFAKWYSPSKENIHKVGIKPDKLVKLPDIFYTKYVILDENEVVDSDQVHEAVAYVQKGLKFLGYHDGRIDGYYDEVTRTSLLSFKIKSNLSRDSKIDQDTIKSVYSAVIKEWSHNRKNHDVQYHKALEVVSE